MDIHKNAKLTPQCRADIVGRVVDQVRACVGRLDLVPDHVRQRRLDDLPRVVRLLRRPIPEAGPVPVRPLVRHGKSFI